MWNAVRCAALTTSLGLGTAAGALPSQAAEANQLTVSISQRDDRFGIVATNMSAVSGDLNREGLLLKLVLGSGVDEEDGASSTVDAMLGYQVVFDDWKVRAFGGVTMVEFDGDNTFGLKAQVQAQNKRSSDLHIVASATYSGAAQSVQGKLQLGGHLTEDLIFGPEASVTLTPDDLRTRLGVFLTGIKLGDIGLTVRAGYAYSDASATGSYYAGASATLQY